MRASSFLGTLGRAHAVVRERRAARTLGDERASWSAVADVHEATCDLVDLTTAGLPLPPLDRQPPADADEAVASVLEERYEEFAGDSEPAATDGGDWRSAAVDDTPTAYTADDRVDTVNGHTVVPLARDGPAAANWYVLGDVLSNRAAGVATDCRTLADRHRLAGSTAVGDEWAATADLLSAVAACVDHHAALARWVHVPDRETVEGARRARRAASQLNDETRNLQ